MGRQDQGLVGHAAPHLAACLQRRTQPLQSTLPLQLSPAFFSGSPLIRGQQVVAGAGSYHVEACETGWSWKPLCWGSPLRSRADPLRQCQKVHITPAHRMSLLSLASYARTGYSELGLLCPKQEPFRGGQEKLPGGKSPPGSSPHRSHRAARALAGRRCHRSGSGGKCWGQAQGAAVFPQLRLPSKSNIVGTRQAPCTGSTYMGLS